MKKNVVLCGFMGCGKSTVGKRLAPMLGCRFIDMDHYIEQQAGKSVSEIFAEEGEAAFRAMEYAACETLGKTDGLVIATGGGAVLRQENVQALRQNGTIVWLRVTPETVLKRLAGDRTRPLLMRSDKEAAVRDLMAQREPLYRAAADLVVEGDGDALSATQAVRKALTR